MLLFRARLLFRKCRGVLLVFFRLHNHIFRNFLLSQDRLLRCRRLLLREADWVCQLLGLRSVLAQCFVGRLLVHADEIFGRTRHIGERGVLFGAESFESLRHGSGRRLTHEQLGCRGIVRQFLVLAERAKGGPLRRGLLVGAAHFLVVSCEVHS